jgi:DNA-binding NtrC family response regulator
MTARGPDGQLACPLKGPHVDRDGPNDGGGKFPRRKKVMPRLCILIVDDEPLIRWCIGETLQQLGHSVSEARDAQETLQTLSAGPIPDVILLDYRLPDSNDLSLLETIRRVAPNSPVIMMTAHGTPEMNADALRLGAFRVISKPMEMRDMAPLVDQAYASRPH